MHPAAAHGSLPEVNRRDRDRDTGAAARARAQRGDVGSRRWSRCATCGRPGTAIALRGLTATVTTLQPQLRYLGPYQTVCNYWNYFWTFLGEHVSQDSTGSRAARARQEHRPAANNPARWAPPSPPTARAYRGRPQSAQPPYGAAMTPTGEADCENGQRGSASAARFGPRGTDRTDPRSPAQGPTYAAARACPRPDIHARARDGGRSRACGRPSGQTHRARG